MPWRCPDALSWVIEYNGGSSDQGFSPLFLISISVKVISSSLIYISLLRKMYEKLNSPEKNNVKIAALHSTVFPNCCPAPIS